MSLNKLMEELSIQTLSGFDAETRFRARAAQADPQRALAILDRVDEKTTPIEEGYGMLVCQRPGQRRLSDFDVAQVMRDANDRA